MKVKTKSELEEARRGNYQSYNQYTVGYILHVWLNSGEWTLKNGIYHKDMTYPELA